MRGVLRIQTTYSNESTEVYDAEFDDIVDEWSHNLLAVKNIELPSSCSICMKWQMHAIQAKVCRIEYRKDKEQNLQIEKDIYAGDMEKIITIPSLPRMIAFNETFSPIGGKNDLRNTIAILWHEEMKDRCDEDLCSTVTKILYHPKNNLVFWFHNCCTQNENWTL